MFRPNELQQAVAARGAVFLDENLPGWERYLTDWATLNLNSVDECVLAKLAVRDPRLAGTRVCDWPFRRALHQLPPITYLSDYGFSCEYGSNAVMKRAWGIEIKRRLGINTEKEAKRIKRDLRIVEPDEAYLASVLGQAAYELVA